MSSDTSIQYHWVDGVECLENYEPGGYHPVEIDDLLHNRYRIVDKLGYGGYSTIWLARDEEVDRFVAVKVGISKAPLRREYEILRALHDMKSDSQRSDSAPDQSASTPLPRVFDTFEICGPNGTHSCYTLTPAQGSLSEAKWCRLFPIGIARALAAKLATAVAFVHSRGFVHGDLRLQNVLVRLPSEFDKLSVTQFKEKHGEPRTELITRVDDKPLTDNVPAHAVLPVYLGKQSDEFTLTDVHGLILSDFGEAYSPATERRLGRDCHTPLLKRAPESLFEPDEVLSYPSDIWSLGCAIWDILCMKFFLYEMEPVDEVVAEQIDILGYHTLPESWKKKWERPDEEDNHACEEIPRRPIGDREVLPGLEQLFEKCVQKYRREEQAAGVFEEDETRALMELLHGMFKFKPEERLTIDEVLRSTWMVKWALPQLEESQTSGSSTS